MEGTPYKRRLDEMHDQSSLLSAKRRKETKTYFPTINSKFSGFSGNHVLDSFDEGYRRNVSAVSRTPDTPFLLRSKVFSARPDIHDRKSGFFAGGSSEQLRIPSRQRHQSPRRIWHTPTVAKVPTSVTRNGLSSVKGRLLPLYSGNGSLHFAPPGGIYLRTASRRIEVGKCIRDICLSEASRERLNFEEVADRNETMERKQEQKALELKPAISERIPVAGEEMHSGNRGDSVQADARNSDILQLEEYRRRVTFIQADAERISVAKASSDLQETRFQTRKDPATEALPNRGVERPGVYDSGESLNCAENDGHKNLASIVARRDGNRVDDPGDWRALLEKTNRRNPKLNSFKLDTEYLEKKIAALALSRPPSLKQKKEERETADAFTPLSEDAEKEVEYALHGPDRNKVLIFHKKSGIDVTRSVMQCLLPGAWLNDEVINVYMELLKERELQEPEKFLKCHFFNTFFYNKLYKDKRSYDFKAVRRWTTQKKVGYSLANCDKILVPIHQDIHWCLAIINIRDKKLQYLDSLGGVDSAVLKVLARYIADEARDKDGKELDTNTWDHEFPQDIPQQLNGCDCGMFMLKYADFHSRGVPLSFKQADMGYFRRRMVWELLQLKAT
ncbi:hypothetical protein R1sor_004312 [Riccia sorocarpa]|uniref:Ubiquitin-like protease family profile domain-containing protein n=1 Tax=Riccia sorocarpa TaxID=122646 RepID=A0ABD3HID3_9MARC